MTTPVGIMKRINSAVIQCSARGHGVGGSVDRVRRRARHSHFSLPRKRVRVREGGDLFDMVSNGGRPSLRLAELCMGKSNSVGLAQSLPTPSSIVGMLISMSERKKGPTDASDPMPSAVDGALRTGNVIFRRAVLRRLERVLVVAIAIVRGGRRGRGCDDRGPQKPS
jgi:hypothetical protein